MLVPPERGNDWLGLTSRPLPVEAAVAWAQLPSCGGTVCFTGTVRDHAGERSGVEWLDYEAYSEQVEPRLRSIAADARRRWPDLGRLVLLHRVGRVLLSEVAVVAVVSAPHREEAFAGARFAIDALKHSVPIWKKESWEGGESWATGAHPIRDLATRSGRSRCEAGEKQ
ncbi:MAG: molybdenum cofactor biosynthesis protein MoaE [Actinobacteria bacterium]|nr:molybdenum cofactor biosynthesis protein MoaE [Actinomycetota bacterium]